MVKSAEKYLMFAGMAVVGILITCCTRQIPLPEQISVSWGVISNNYSDTAKVKSRFVIENKSKYTFNSGNWALYYNQSPREPLSATGNVVIEHLSGDWYRMKPTEKFRLKPGEKSEITAESSYWLIKESDAPCGLYFVLYDSKGTEKEIIPVKNYHIEPFTKPEQVTRHRADFEAFPTARLNFKNNEKLTVLSANELLPIIPSPVGFKKTGNEVLFDNPVEILYQKGLENEAEYISLFLNKLFGFKFTVKEAQKPASGSLFLSTAKISVSGKSKEAYRLKISKDKSIEVAGSDPAGVFYGLQSLISLLPAELYSNPETPVVLPEVEIEDAPRFEYRGLHIDVARNFQSKETIKKVVDVLSHYKGNYLLLYITEDEGWRLAIEELPELTEIGGKRGHTSKASNALHPSYGSGPFSNAEGSHGSGFYSREDFKEILKYAHSRHVNIIPEVNFPGHSRAAIKAMEARYEKFMAIGDSVKANEFRLIDPDDKSEYLSAQWYNDNIVCVARESVYKFYETVIDDIMEMYKEAGVPLEYFHTGGDEVPEGVWAKSPLCTKLMETLPHVKDPKNLQAYFFGKAVEILNRKNLKIAGWEEVALMKNESGNYVSNPEFAGKNVYPFVWNNLDKNTDLANRLANAGYPVVQCNVSNFYFDLAYNNDPREPGLYWAGFVDTRDAWQVAPNNLFYTTTHSSMGKEIEASEYEGLEKLKSEARKNIAGVEAHLWAETVKGPAMLEHYLLPKLAGFAESAWAAERKWESEPDKTKRTKMMDENWNIFANSLAQKELPKLSRIFGGFNYYLPVPGAKIENGKLYANSEYPGLIIRYTTDGKEPDKSSPEYKEPVPVDGNLILKAFDMAGHESKTIEVKPD